MLPSIPFILDSPRPAFADSSPRLSIGVSRSSWALLKRQVCAFCGYGDATNPELAVAPEVADSTGQFFDRLNVPDVLPVEALGDEVTLLSLKM